MAADRLVARGLPAGRAEALSLVSALPQRPHGGAAGRRHCLTGWRGLEYITAAPNGAIRPSPGV